MTMTAAQTTLINQRKIVTPAEWTLACGNQTSDSDAPDFYTINETPFLMASAFAPRDYAFGAVGVFSRFEVHQGDRNFADEAGHKDCDRCSVMTRDDTLVVPGQAWQLSIDMMVEPGDPNTASWFLLAQFHQDINTSKLPGSPPIALEMVKERLQVRARWGANGNDGQAGNFNKVIWTDTADVVRGERFRITITGMFDPVAGMLNVTKDGATTKYRGPLGYTKMAGAYFDHGIYRATVPEVMAVQQHVAYWWLSPLVF